ncbi:hypothetical protein CLV71_1289 [Actinophytocola oryzae]|uniref:Uncharacterized protein n=1 Tax=Actinophytocola oryzae TaxID=502181 RepID=A0A4R7UTE1_9PSEU|nr:hypothetical protein CLV71_1289 [Actinophytocola oryzae]
MSATHRWSGAAAVKSRSSRSAGLSTPGIVVRGRLRGAVTPQMPSSRISRSTVHRDTTMPSRLSCPHTFRAPYRPRPGPCHTRRISPFNHSFRTARADGLDSRFLAAQYVDGDTSNTVQIGSTPNRSRWVSMNSTSAAVSGRVPGRKTPTRPSESRSPAATHDSPAPAQRSAQHRWSTCRPVSRHRPQPGAPTSATPPDAPQAGQRPDRSARSAHQSAHEAQRPSEPHVPAAQTSTSSVVP